ncbi:MAG: ATP-dependent zinc metalloprotease FtsH [Bacteroidales bacterium]|nr:ATP-dependent zinc metalloprotease FtsH [Bacteroidales bacterium]MCF8390242.1 ATP-dependent zinc metalloprotease FtsH [Bacteroidales bacterium]
MSDSKINKDSSNKNSDPQKPKIQSYWIYIAIAVVFLGMQFINFNKTVEEIGQLKLEELINQHSVAKIVLVNKEKAEIYLKESSENNSPSGTKSVNSFSQVPPNYVYNFLSAEDFSRWIYSLEKEMGAANFPEVTSLTRKNYVGDIMGWILPIILLVAIWLFIFRKMSGGAGGGGAGNIFSVGKSKAQIFDKNTNVKIDFKDVAGLEEAKVEVNEIVDFLKNPKKYTDLGGKIPKGALLVGPPGTGKTLLAKAVAGEANVPFFSISGSDFVEMFVGVGASRVRDLFKQAKEKAPCIVFIDEIDAVGRARGRNASLGSNDERENTLNQLLTEMDGFGTNSGVIILAATNRSDVLDKALLRAGRFDRQISVELPDLNERKEIFKVHIRPLKLSKEIDIDFFSKQTPGFSGADIANVCNESALIAARSNKKKIGKQDFLDAIDRIIGGLEKKNKIISAEEKKTIAFHEAGHATISWLLPHANPLVKVTIIPRGRALGAAWYLPEERQITTTEQLLDELCATLGGRASEELTFNKISTGALNDLERVTKQAYAMISYFGMSKEIGNLSYYDSSGQGDYTFTKPYSEKTAEKIDLSVKELISIEYERAKKILKDNVKGLTELAQQLLEKEVIFSEDLERIFGKRKVDAQSLTEVPKKPAARRSPVKKVLAAKTSQRSAKKNASGENDENSN